MADGQEQAVAVYNPQGVSGTIPASQVEAAKAQGYHLHDDVIRAIHPYTGEKGVIPKEQWGDAQKQGYILAPEEQAKVESAKIITSPKRPSVLQRDPFTQPGNMSQGTDMTAPTETGAGTLNLLPSVAGAAGGAIAGVPGAAAGGALGEAARQGLAPLAAIPRSDTPVKTVAEEGAIQGVAEGGGRVVSKIAEKVGPAILRQFIKPPESAFAYGKDPVKAVMDIPGVPGTKKELATKVFQELQNTGNQISSVIKAAEKQFPNAPTTMMVDVGKTINDPIDREIAAISSNRGMEASLKKGVIEKLEDLRSGIMDTMSGGKHPTVLKLSDANKLKQDIGAGTDWRQTTNAIEAKAQPIVNGLRREIYNGIKQGIETKIPGIKDLNLKYGSLLDAQKSIEKRLNTGPLVTISDLLLAIKSPGVAAISKAATSTAPGAVAVSKALRGVGTKAGGVGVSSLLRTIAAMLENNPGPTSQPKP